MAYAMIGGARGSFEQDLRGHSPQTVEFFNDQFALAAVIGGHIELNRSPRWVFRITPDAKYTRYSINYGNQGTLIRIGTLRFQWAWSTSSKRSGRRRGS